MFCWVVDDDVWHKTWLLQLPTTDNVSPDNYTPNNSTTSPRRPTQPPTPSGTGQCIKWVFSVASAHTHTQCASWRVMSVNGLHAAVLDKADWTRDNLTWSTSSNSQSHQHDVCVCVTLIHSWLVPSCSHHWTASITWPRQRWQRCVNQRYKLLHRHNVTIRQHSY